MKKLLLLFVFVLCGLTYSQTTTVDSNNQLLTSALAADSVWNGNYVNLVTHNIASVTIAVYSDSASATNGFKVYFSPDGSAVIDSIYKSISAGTVWDTILTPYTKYYKIQYTNGTKATNTTIIQPIIRTENKGY